MNWPRMNEADWPCYRSRLLLSGLPIRHDISLLLQWCCSNPAEICCSFFGTLSTQLAPKDGIPLCTTSWCNTGAGGGFNSKQDTIGVVLAVTDRADVWFIYCLSSFLSYFSSSSSSYFSSSSSSSSSLPLHGMSHRVLIRDMLLYFWGVVWTPKSPLTSPLCKRKRRPCLIPGAKPGSLGRKPRLQGLP